MAVKCETHGLQSGLRRQSENTDSDDETDDENSLEFVSAALRIVRLLICYTLESDPTELNDECLVMLEMSSQVTRDIEGTSPSVCWCSVTLGGVSPSRGR